MALEYKSLPTEAGVLPEASLPNGLVGNVPATVEYAVRATLAYTDTAAKTLFTLPSGAVITDWVLNVTEAFDDTGTDQVNLGITGTAAKFASSLDVSSTGLKTSGVVAAEIGAVQSGAKIVKGIYAGQNSNAAHGAMVVMCRYIVP